MFDINRERSSHPCVVSLIVNKRKEICDYCLWNSDFSQCFQHHWLCIDFEDRISDQVLQECPEDSVLELLHLDVTKNEVHLSEWDVSGLEICLGKV